MSVDAITLNIEFVFTMYITFQLIDVFRNLFLGPIAFWIPPNPDLRSMLFGISVFDTKYTICRVDEEEKSDESSTNVAASFSCEECGKTFA